MENIKIEKTLKEETLKERKELLSEFYKENLRGDNELSSAIKEAKECLEAILRESETHHNPDSFVRALKNFEETIEKINNLPGLSRRFEIVKRLSELNKLEEENKEHGLRTVAD